MLMIRKYFGWNWKVSARSVLDRFCAISGLKMNIEKSKAIWIGSVSKSDIRICRNYNFD